MASYLLGTNFHGFRKGLYPKNSSAHEIAIFFVCLMKGNGISTNFESLEDIILV